VSPTTLQIAWRNLGRNRRRTALALAAIGIGQAALLVMAGVMNGFVDQVFFAVTGPFVGHVQIHAQEWREERAMDLFINDLDHTLEAIRGHERVKRAVPRIYAPVLAAPAEEAFGALVVGIDVDAESAPEGLLAGLERPIETREVVVGNILARRYELEPGQEIAVIGQGADGSLANDLYTVVEVVCTAVDPINQAGIVMCLEDAQELFAMWDAAHEIAIHAIPDTDAKALASSLATDPALADDEVVPWQVLAPELVSYLKMAAILAYLVLILVFIAAAAGIANTMMTATFERMHEFGMLLALGTRPRRIVGMVFTEAVVLGVLGVVLGTGLGLGAVALGSVYGLNMATFGGEAVNDLSFKGLNLPFKIFPRVEVAEILAGLATVVATSLLAALWPASIAARLEPVEAMRA
jgi:ABC-type lipoprotein release transport system permease subunit